MTNDRPVITKHEHGPDGLTIMWDNSGGPPAANGWLLFVGHQVIREALFGYKWDIFKDKKGKETHHTIPVSALDPGRDIYIQVAAITDTIIAQDENCAPIYEVVYSDEIRSESPPMAE